ncbi:hypothetical protein DFJ74DRAFT_690308 [Hyaloraphidium curvatum]|nr:hypothetical protein DFJ74DRAFT_690308 [Hyaloraphidium curvatum]
MTSAARRPPMALWRRLSVTGASCSSKCSLSHRRKQTRVSSWGPASSRGRPQAQVAIDRVGQLIESDLNGLWVRVDQDMSVFRDYVNNLGSNLGRELSPQEQEAYDALSSRVGEGHYDLQDWYTRKKDSALVQAKCRELQPAPPANAPLLPVKVAPGVTVQGGFGLPPPPPSYT